MNGAAFVFHATGERTRVTAAANVLLRATRPRPFAVTPLRDDNTQSVLWMTAETWEWLRRREVVETLRVRRVKHG